MSRFHMYSIRDRVYSIRDGVYSIRNGVYSIRDGVYSIRNGVYSIRDGVYSIRNGVHSIWDGVHVKMGLCTRPDRPSLWTWLRVWTEDAAHQFRALRAALTRSLVAVSRYDDHLSVDRPWGSHSNAWWTAAASEKGSMEQSALHNGKIFSGSATRPKHRDVASRATRPHRSRCTRHASSRSHSACSPVLRGPAKYLGALSKIRAATAFHNAVSAHSQLLSHTIQGFMLAIETAASVSCDSSAALLALLP